MITVSEGEKIVVGNVAISQSVRQAVSQSVRQAGRHGFEAVAKGLHFITNKLGWGWGNKSKNWAWFGLQDSKAHH